MDEEERCFYYKGFLLMCDPQPLSSGGYRAKVAVCLPREGDRADVVLAESPDGVHLISEEAAVEYARSWAVDWVDRNHPG